jgi:hypothetical protein
MKVACVTTCRGRLDHLKITLPQNIRDRGGNGAVFVLLDYNDQNGLGDYIQREHKADLDAGRLVYYRNKDAPKFRMAHAKNQAHRCGMLEGAWVMCNLDADNFAGPQFTDYIANKFIESDKEQEAVFLGARGNHRGPGNLVRVKTPPGCFGRIAVLTDAFRQVGGYDEVFSGWSPDDKDFAQRVSNIGYGWRRIHTSYLKAIKHGPGLRFRECENSELDEVTTLEGRANLRIVNSGHVGTGVVYRNFSSEPIELKPIPTRVFGIGLHKTGTTSLAQAFRIMGLDAAHWESPHWARYIWQEMKETGSSRTLEMHYALCDLPIPLLYEQLDAAYPGSRFILTVRDEDAWINSIRVHWQAMRQDWNNDVFSNEIHRELYGTTEFDEQIFRERYRRHNDDVMCYFHGRSDFMRLEIRPETSMLELSRFLGMPAMHRKFPHKHKTTEQPKYQRVL